METVVNVAGSIVTTITDAATSFASGFGNAVVNTFNTILINEDGNLSNLAIWGLVFGGVGLIIGLSKIFTRKLAS